MKDRFLYLFVLLSILFAGNCEAQPWIWAKGAGGGLAPFFSFRSATFQWSRSICTDSQGSVYITGDYNGPTIVFGTVSLVNPDTTVRSNHSFLTKYDPNGQVLWARTFGDSITCSSAAVCTDTAGNVFITGFFGSPTIAFGNAILFNNSGNSMAVFVAKLDASGNVLWASGGGDAEGSPESVCADSKGNVYLTGSFDLHTTTFGPTILQNPGLTSVFLVKYDIQGHVIWASGAPGNGLNQAFSVVADKNGNTYITGVYSSDSLTFGAQTISNNAGGISNGNVFLVKYDANGNALWARSGAASVSNSIGYCVCLDPSGNAYMTGAFESPSINFGSAPLLNKGDQNIFIVKYDPSGNVLWTQAAGGGGTDAGYTLSVDHHYNLYVSGGQSSTSMKLGTYMLTQPGSSVDGLFVVKYDSLGNVVCAASLLGGAGNPNSISTDDFGNAYIGGCFTPNKVPVGADTLVLTTKSPWITNGDPNGSNIYLAKFTCGCNPIVHITGPSRFCGSGGTIELTANGGRVYHWNTGASTAQITVNADTTTTYTVISAYGYCSDTAFKTVSVFPVPSNEIVSSQLLDLCEGEHTGSITTHTSSGTPPYTFAWSPGGQTTESLSSLSGGTYTLSVIDTKGCSIRSAPVIINSPALFVPNYFSPNNDGTNDKLCLYGNCLPSFTFSIYDRLGELVFETNDPLICWDGNYRGMPMDSQVFVYNLIATLPEGGSFKEKGIINLVR